MSSSCVPHHKRTSTSEQTSNLVDRFGRVHRSLRVSVTDICNIRCKYCMPEENPQFLKPEKRLSYAAIHQFVLFAVSQGISSVRITGGEPLVRADLHSLIAKLASIKGLEDLALTTNGILLKEQAHALVEAGLKRINISLDTLSEDVFRRISRREGLDRVLEGIDVARSIDGLELKLNTLVLRDVNLNSVLDLVEYAQERQLPLRFIEFMPLDAERAWNAERMVSGAELRERIETKFGKLERVQNGDPSRPSRDYRLRDGGIAVLGFIDSVSTPFCSTCDRLRLTADGKVRNCLFSQKEWDVAPILAQLKNNQSNPRIQQQLGEQLKLCLQAKYAAHGIAQPDFEQPERPMYRIGG